MFCAPSLLRSNLKFSFILSRLPSSSSTHRISGMGRQDSVLFTNEFIEAELDALFQALRVAKQIHLPDEICEKIVRFNQNRPDVLAALTLVSRQWNIAASPLLWFAGSL